jgi:hypothetical protein
MKKILVILLLALMSCNSQNKVMFTKSLKIKHTSGDESYKVQEMIFYVKENKVLGRITVPYTDELLSSETELDQQSINFLNSFLKLAKDYKNGCKENNISSSVEYYEIDLDNEAFKIFQFCNWKSFAYQNLEKQIFGDYLKNLEKKQKEFNLLFSSKIIGKWKENEKLENLVLESKWNLTKLDSETTDSEYLEFLNNQKAILNRKGKKTYYDFRIDVIAGKKYLLMSGDDVKNGDEEFVYGQKFEILEISHNKIKMAH